VHWREAVGGDLYEFKHALVRDAAYESLLKSRRQELQRSLGDHSVLFFAINTRRANSTFRLPKGSTRSASTDSLPPSMTTPYCGNVSRSRVTTATSAEAAAQHHTYDGEPATASILLAKDQTSALNEFARWVSSFQSGMKGYVC
jgi:hypothetical protein